MIQDIHAYNKLLPSHEPNSVAYIWRTQNGYSKEDVVEMLRQETGIFRIATSSHILRWEKQQCKPSLKIIAAYEKLTEGKVGFRDWE